MVHILKNPDGTVNFDAVQKEAAYLKGKYAQGAENAKKNAQRQEHQATSGESQTSDQPSQPHKSGDIVPPKAQPKDD
ncbi:hypothetical protein BCV70DRAFT_217482 [Testicularia cyperi]|uniref:Uncharacterized protein n=1 Tax=Testicularia cyperi TaxID=1882483 RepID=A0A317XNU2_9BASI|nr:hypothetical protein BCV70DRAFT_217482 [Testicularia cyperi]